jgi:putative ABC transport system ATP-binding protein
VADAPFASAPAPVVAGSGLYYRYAQGASGDDVLRGAALDVAAGEIVLLRGHSGSGKTTLLSVLAGLLRPARGTVTLTGTDLARLDRAARARLRLDAVGFVFQRFHLIAALRARENVELVLRAGGVAPREARARALATLDALGLAGKTERFPRELSGGEQQRVGIARAIAKRPAIIFADEPTSSLDSAAGAEATALLCDLARGGGSAVLIASHDERITPYVDRVVPVADGRCG